MTEKKDFKKKWDNYWYYYKPHTFAGIFVLFLVIVTVVQCVNTVNPDVNLAIVTESIVSQEQLDFDTAFADVIADVNQDEKKHISAVEMYISANPKDETERAMMQKVDLEFASGEISLYIFDKTNLDRYITRDAFEPLDRFINLSDYSNEIVKRDDKPVAISLKGSQKLAQMGVVKDDLYAAFMFVRKDFEKKDKRMAEYENATAILKELLK